MAITVGVVPHSKQACRAGSASLHAGGCSERGDEHLSARPCAEQSAGARESVEQLRSRARHQSKLHTQDSCTGDVEGSADTSRLSSISAQALQLRHVAHAIRELQLKDAGRQPGLLVAPQPQVGGDPVNHVAVTARLLPAVQVDHAHAKAAHLHSTQHRLEGLA